MEEAMFDRQHEAHHQGGIGACMHGQVMMDGKKKHFCELVNLQIVERKEKKKNVVEAILNDILNKVCEMS